MPGLCPLDVPHVGLLLEHALAAAATRQITDPRDPDHGAIVNPDWGIADPAQTSTGAFVSAAVLLRAAQSAGQAPPRDGALAAALPDRLAQATQYLLRAQRPSGRIDLRHCNYDSGPDTGFVVQQLCAATETAARLAPRDAALRPALDDIRAFCARAVPGMIAGGFHTPNHRWVTASAIAWAGTLFDLPGWQAGIAPYLAEGIDIDDEGFFSERSAGIYDAVCDRSLLALAEHASLPGGRELVRRNLAANLALLQPDGTLDTALSHRQDFGTRPHPLALASCFLHSAALDPEPSFAGAAETIFTALVERHGLAAAQRAGLAGLGWLIYALLRFGPPQGAQPVPTCFERHFAANGLWRVRRGGLTASFRRGSTCILSLHHGAAELAALKVSLPYFGVGRFSADEMTVEGTTLRLHSRGDHKPHRPGYDFPLNRPVPRTETQWYSHVLSERQWRALPPADLTLEARLVEGGFDLRLRSRGVLPDVPAQITFDFAPGGVWEAGDCCLPLRAGQVLILKSGAGRMSYGPDAIEVGPGPGGARAPHYTWAMRDTEQAPHHARVLIPLRTPLDHCFRIRAVAGA